MLATAALTAWFYFSGYRTFHGLRAAWREEADLEAQVERLKEQNRKIEREIEDLAPGGPGIERKARQELGWSKADEIVIRIPDKK